MKKEFVFYVLLLIVYLSSFLNTLFANNYLFIQSNTYVQLSVALVSFFIFLFSIVSSKKIVFPKDFRCHDVAILFLISFFAIRYLFSTAFNHLNGQLITLVACAFFYIILNNFIDNNKTQKIKILFFFISLIGCFQIFYAILQLIGLLPVLFNFKFGGSFGNPGDLANFLAVTWSVNLLLFIWERNNWRKWLLGVIILLHLFLLVISVARTAWIAVFVSTLFLLLNTNWVKRSLERAHSILKHKKWVKLLIIVGFVLLTAIVGWRMYEMKSSSADGRLFIWKTCIQLIKEKPLFGHGYESFLTVQRNTQIEYFANHPDDIKKGMLAANCSFAFNDFLQFTVEYGMVGLLLLLTIFLLPFRRITTKTDTEKQIIVTTRAVFIAIFICALFSYPLQNQTIMLLFVTFFAISSSYDNTPILSFPLTRKVKVPALMVFLGLSLLLLNFNIQKIENGLKWKKAHALSQSEPEKAFNIYSEIHDFMDHDRSFISNYGSIFYSLKKYDKLVEYYEKFGYLCTSSDILLMVGESYEKLENYSKAETYYRKASNLIPHLFVPRYRLLKLYLKQGLDEKAKLEAEKIRVLPIKVYSDKVKGIKTEVNEYLYNSSSQ